MRRLAAVTAVMLCATAAQGWETIVRDSDGTRIVELRSPADAEESVVSVSCYPDYGTAALFIGMRSLKDYALRPGDAVTLEIGSLALPGSLMANDSARTVAVAEAIDVPAVLGLIKDESSLQLGIRDIAAARMTVDRGDSAEAFAQFTQACGL